MKAYRLKHFLERNDGGCWGDDPTGIDDTIVLRSTEQSANGAWRITDPALRHISASERKTKTIDLNDIIITKSSGSADHIGKASIADKSVADLEAVYSNFMQRIRVSHNASPRYVWHLLNSSFARYHYNVYATSTSGLGNLNGTIIGNLPFPVAKLPTQKRIAAFLDRETARIDALIAKKERLVKVLQESLLSKLERLVTPAIILHEELIPFRWVCRVTEGQVDPTRPEWAAKPLIAPNHIVSRTGRITGIETAEDQGAISGKYTFPAETVLYSKIRPNLAKACVSPVEGMCSADMYPILPDRRLRPRFLLMQLLSEKFTDWATLESMRVAMPKINRETLGGYRLWVPALEVQDVAVREYFAAQARHDTLSGKIELSIDRLREYRSALITAAVTGQIDVDADEGTGAVTARLDRIEEEMSS